MFKHETKKNTFFMISKLCITVSGTYPTSLFMIFYRQGKNYVEITYSAQESVKDVLKWTDPFFNYKLRPNYKKWRQVPCRVHSFNISDSLRVVRLVTLIEILRRLNNQQFVLLN